MVMSLITSIRKEWGKGAARSLIGLCLMLPVCAQAANEVQTGVLSQQGPIETLNRVDVGVLATRGSLLATQRWQPMMDWLQQQIPNTNFSLHPFTLDEMEAAVRTQSIDFVITNPGQSVILGRQYPLSWLATLKSNLGGRSTFSIGSALVVRTDSSYQTLTDLKGKEVAAVSETAFGGYLTIRRKMQQMGLEPATFFSDIEFSGFPLDAIVYKLRDLHVEGIIIPVCQLETMNKEGLVSGERYRVLDNMAPPGFACELSTPLYPNWSFAKTGKASEWLAKKIARVLLALPEEHPAAVAALSLGWTTPISQLTVDRLYQDLDLHPLQKPWWQEALSWLKANQQWGWALVILILVLNIYHFVLEYRFNKSKRLLLETQHRLKEKNAMLEHAQRVAVVGELGSSLAHEINQPLAAIRNYSQGGLVRIGKGSHADELKPVLEKIQQQVIRADEVVQRLRALINKRPVNKCSSDVEVLLSDTLHLLDHDFDKKQLKVSRLTQGEPVSVFLDPVGFQQLLLNLLTNAADACLMRKDAESHQIVISTAYTEDLVVLTITDNGIGLQASAETLQGAFYTTKNHGLGLGLAICRDVVEDHHGELLLSSATPCGCQATVILPLQQTD